MCVIFPTDLIRKYGLFKRETTIYNDDDYYYYDDNEHFLDTIKLLIEDECIKIDDTAGKSQLFFMTRKMFRLPIALLN